jgi:hypothetical protein
MTPATCPYCNATLSPQEEAEGRCGNCGQRPPAPVTTGPATDTAGDAVPQFYDDLGPGEDIRKQRHGCATAWLVLMIVANAFAALRYLIAGGQIQRQLPGFPVWAVPVLTVGCLLNIVFAVALLSWKKWGFYGFVALSALAFAVNLAAGVGALAVTGLIGVAILFAVLQIGGKRSTWRQLE